MVKHNRFTRRKRRYRGLGKVKKDIKWLKKNVEFKFHDRPSVQSEASTAGVLDLLSGVGFPDVVSAVANLEPNTRMGDEITARRITVRGTFTIGPTPTDCTVRVMLVRQKSGHGTTPAIGELLAGGLLVHSFRNMDRKTEWHVYADHTFAMETAGFGRIPFKFNFKLNHQQRFSGTGNSTMNVQMNGIYIVFMSSLAAGTTAPDVTYTSRYYFCDS